MFYFFLLFPSPLKLNNIQMLSCSNFLHKNINQQRKGSTEKGLSTCFFFLEASCNKAREDKTGMK